MGAMLPPIPPSKWGSAPNPDLVSSGKAAFKAVFLVLVLVAMGAMLPPIPPLIWATAHKSLEEQRVSLFGLHFVHPNSAPLCSLYILLLLSINR